MVKQRVFCLHGRPNQGETNHVHLMLAHQEFNKRNTKWRESKIGRVQCAVRHHNIVNCPSHPRICAPTTISGKKKKSRANYAPPPIPASVDMDGDAFARAVQTAICVHRGPCGMWCWCSTDVPTPEIRTVCCCSIFLASGIVVYLIFVFDRNVLILTANHAQWAHTHPRSFVSIEDIFEWHVKKANKMLKTNEKNPFECVVVIFNHSKATLFCGAPKSITIKWYKFDSRTLSYHHQNHIIQHTEVKESFSRLVERSMLVSDFFLCCSKFGCIT